MLLDIVNAELGDAMSAIVSDRSAALAAIMRIITGLHDRIIERCWGR